MPNASRFDFYAVSCPSRSLCVAGGNDGVLAWSTHPQGGAAGWRTAIVDREGTSPAQLLGAFPVDAHSTITSLSCPSVSFCVAVDDSGHVLWSRRPAGGPRAWTTQDVDGSNALTGISCPSVTLCVTVDRAGSVLSSRRPTTGARGWRAVRLFPGLSFGFGSARSAAAVSCPSLSLCFAIADDGRVGVGVDPAGSARSWTLSRIPATDFPRGYGVSISCASVSLCVSVFDARLLVSARPSGGSSTWRLDFQPPSQLLKVSCSRRHLCAAVGGNGSAGEVFTSTDPGGGQLAWSPAPVSGPSLHTFGGAGVACRDPSLCVALGHSSVITSTGPGGDSGWRTGSLRAGYNGIVAIRCPSPRLCVAIDDAGNVLASRRPTSGSAAWSVSHVDTEPLLFLACPSTSLCVGLDGAGNVISSTRPAAGRGAWRRAHVFAPGSTLDGSTFFGLSCPSATLCVGLTGGGGDVISSSHPAGGAGAWQVQHVDLTEAPCGTHDAATCAGELTAISCASPTLCVAVDTNGYALSSTDPAGGAESWTARLISADAQGAYSEGGDELEYLSCPSRSFCAAAGASGAVIATSIDPAGGSWTVSRQFPWRSDSLSLYAISDLTCPSKSLCLALGFGFPNSTVQFPAPYTYTGFASSAPTGAWGRFALHPMSDWTSVTCQMKRLCIALDGLGNLAAATDPGAGSSAWTSARVRTHAIRAVACPSSTLCVIGDDFGQIGPIRIRRR